MRNLLVSVYVCLRAVLKERRDLALENLASIRASSFLIAAAQVGMSGYSCDMSGFPVSRCPEEVIGSPEAFRKSRLVLCLTWPGKNRVEASRKWACIIGKKTKSDETEIRRFRFPTILARLVQDVAVTFRRKDHHVDADARGVGVGATGKISLV